MDRTGVLSDDALADILGRLPPCNLAVSRCVRKAWRAVVDDYGLLLPHVLPHTVRGLFLGRKGHEERPISFFARPSTHQPTVDGKLDFLPHYGGFSRRILDHCNGLLLCGDFKTLCVVNPVTRRWDDLPWEEDDCKCKAYLAFDPVASLHYEVLSVPSELEKLVVKPPSSWTLNLFSSSTEQWHKRTFVREAEAMDNVRLGSRSMWWQDSTCSVYWKGSLYVNFCGLFLVRLLSPGAKYRVIKTPVDLEEYRRVRPYVGKSECGVYFATFHLMCRLQVWILVESSEGIDWVSKHHIDLNPCANRCLRDLMVGLFDKTWIQDADGKHLDGNNGMLMAENFDWDSDDDNVVNIQDRCERYCNFVSFLGFHAYKEVIFVGLESGGGEVAVVAYHLNSSKVQYLGRLHPLDHTGDNSGDTYESFPYTPCMIGHLLKQFRGS